ncbi:MAG: oligopeptide transporter, OPT family [Candidatus Eisenbacteria bacterium]|nr:oligopeptide transporter, OPT family [Candidatus Latescibacterota bacterium]MBD3303343.1 oligopeptide transporter, OPT family [Candidatus Eisenbacteria bacterium]
MNQGRSGGPDPGASPTIPSNVRLPEITAKALVLGVLLAAVLAGANAYLGLFAGMTVSASIPAAVISMGLLTAIRGIGLSKQTNILENNIVQTAASAGESLAAGVIFTFPALVLMGYWTRFEFTTVTLIAGLGGLLGVLFTIPLRRALIAPKTGALQFPEGVATAEVLRTGSRGGGGVVTIGIAALVGALFKLGQTGLRIWTETFESARRIALGSGEGTILYFGSNLSPALLSVGYIVGINIASLVFLGGAANWLVAIPIFAASNPWPMAGGEPVAAAEWAGEIWSTRTRYLGVGAMVVGGLWALIGLRGSLFEGIASGLRAARGTSPGAAGGVAIPRTERDTPMRAVLWAMGLSVIPIFLLYLAVVDQFGVSLIMAVIMLVAGFLFSAVAAYMAGLVGSSNNPISGVTIATLLFSSLLLLLLLGSGAARGPEAAILIGAVVCCAAAIAGDNMQDLKTGHLVGATPWKQQVMQGVGTVSAALVMAPILTLLLKAYGFGEPTAAHPNPLTAPQAALMASVAQGVFARDLPWTMVAIGMGIGILIILLDEIQKARGAAFRFPVLAVAVGIYLPFELSVPIFLGGIVSLVIRRVLAGRGASRARIEASGRTGLLLASGLITGEALVGILMAIPIVATGDPNVLALIAAPIGAWPGILLLLAVAGWMLAAGLRSREPAA